MADKDDDDDVRIPRKVWNAVVASLIDAAYWLIVHGYQWMVEIDKHPQATDRSVYELQQKVK